MSMHASVLASNDGSSCIRFALFELVEPQRPVLCGKVDLVVSSGTNLTTVNADVKPLAGLNLDAESYCLVLRPYGHQFN
jgi:acetate kinase